MIESECEGQRTRRADVQGQEKMDVAAQSNRESKFSLHLPFRSPQIINETDNATSIPEGCLLYSVH